MAPPAASLACACCGKEPEAGRKWPSCELCYQKNLPTTSYCSAACQATHWKGGHKAWHATVEERRKLVTDIGMQVHDHAAAKMQARAAERSGSEYHRVLGEGLAHLGNSHLRYAERSFRKAIQISPESPTAYFNLAATLTRAADHVQAASAYLTASELFPPDSQKWALSIAEAFDELRGCDAAPKPEWWHDEALKELSARVFAVDPTMYPAIRMRAMVLAGAHEAWELGPLGPRSAAELKEAARLSWRAADVPSTGTTEVWRSIAGS